MPATKNPTVEFCVSHFTSFIAIGLRSGDNDLTSPSKKKDNCGNRNYEGILKIFLNYYCAEYIQNNKSKSIVTDCK